MKYSDIIKLPDIKSTCNIILDKSDNYWKSFVPNPSFSEIAEHVINTLSSQNKRERKSFWVQGSYGCGKSHAAIVMLHLLSDEYNEIKDIAARLLPSDDMIAKYNKLRSNNKYLTVTFDGVEGILNVRDAVTVIKERVKATMRAVGIPCNLKTQGEAYIRVLDYLGGMGEGYLRMVLFYDDSPLNRYTDSVEKVYSQLRANDTDYIGAVERTLDKGGIQIPIDNHDIVKWLRDAVEELRKSGYAGLIIFWDELTPLRKALKENLEIWNMFQNIAELGQGGDCCVYLYLISHSTDLVKSEEENHIRDRFHTIHYKMEPVTAYAVMEHLIGTNHSLHYDNVDEGLFSALRTLINGDNPRQDSILRKENFRKLLPLHPATAYLCSFIAENNRSSTRSVAEFVTDKEHGFASFLQQHGTPELCTPDYLWIYYCSRLEENDSNCTDILAYYERYKDDKEVFDTDESKKVYYVLLLLNALSRLSRGTCKLEPTRDHLKLIFEGCSMREGAIDDALEKIEGIVRKDPRGRYTIEHHPGIITEDLEKAKDELREQLTSGAILLENAGFGEKGLEERLKNARTLSSLPRIKSIHLGDVSSASAENSIKKKFSDLREDYEIHLFFFFGITEDEIEKTAGKWNKWVENKEPFIRGKNIITIISTRPLGEERFLEYITYRAIANLYSEMHRQDDSSRNRELAEEILKDWMKRALNPCYIGWEGKCVMKYFQDIDEIINSQYCRTNFKCGAEYFSKLQKKDELWREKTAKQIIVNVANAHNLDELMPTIKGGDDCLKYILQSRDGLYIIHQSLTEFANNPPVDHPLVAIKKFIEGELRKHVDKGPFYISKVLEPLSRSPYGLYKNSISLFILALCLKPYIGKLYNKKGVIGTAGAFKDLITQITGEWMHEGIRPEITQVRFRSQEEQECRRWLAKIFVEVPENPEEDTVTYMKHILHIYTERMEAPLWVLCYGGKYTAFANDWNTILEFFESTKDTRSQSEYKKVNNVFNQYRYEFEKTLTKENFISGYGEFITVCLGRNDAKSIPEIREYVRGQLQRDMDTWRLEDVEGKIQEWKIKRENEEQEFYSWLEKIFKVPKNSATLTYVKDVLRTYTERMGAPLWVLCYGEDDTNFANDWNTIMDFLSSTREIRTLAEYEKVNGIFDRHQDRLMNLAKGDFVSGYDKIIVECLGSRLDPETVGQQLPEIREYVRSQLPLGIDTWRLEDVEQKVSEWEPGGLSGLIDMIKNHVLTTDRYIEMITNIIKAPRNVQKVIRGFYEEPNHPSHE